MYESNDSYAINIKQGKCLQAVANMGRTDIGIFIVCFNFPQM